MVSVGCVVVRAQDHTEHVTGTVAHLMQETRVGIVLRPVPEDADRAAIGQAKPGDVQRTGRGMLAARAVFTAVHVATGEAAEMVDTRHFLPVGGLCSRLQRMPLEQGECHRQGATGEEAAAQRHLAALHPQHVGQRAVGRGVAVSLMGDPQPRRSKGLLTQLRVIAQGHEFVAGQQVRWRPDVQGRPGIPFRRQR